MDNSDLIQLSSLAIAAAASSPSQQKEKPLSKKLFSFGKKKKRKPVCTCHLGAQQYGNGIGSYGSSLDPNIAGSPYSPYTLEYGQSPPQQPQPQTSADNTTGQSGYPRYHSPSPISPRHAPQPPNSYNQMGSHHHHSNPGTPHHHHNHHHHHHQQQQQPSNQTYEASNYLNYSGYCGNGGIQSPSYSLVQSMAVGNAASSPSVLWDGGGGGGGTTNNSAVQYQSVEHTRYQKKLFIKDGTANSYYQAEMLAPDPIGTSSSYSNSYSKYAANGQAGQSGYQNPECGPYPLTDDAGNSNRQLRRWSDGSNARFSKTEADALREEQQLQLQLQLQNTKGNPKASDFYLQNAKNQPYLPNCECSHCRARKPRPKVSFGPSQMYGPEGSGPYDPNLPPSLDPSKGGGGVAGKNSNPWNKLTTELLPLDTQIPLQMMSDSALVCNIL